MTAEEILPPLVNASQSIIASLGDVEIFEGVSLLTALLSLFALSVILEIIIRVLSAGGIIPGDYERTTANMRNQDDWRQYR